jgi:peptidoglycan/xylan/chitin deacetylase (PgdA/CDA1 family)
MLTHRIYYQLKPLIPRSLQILLRRGVALRKRKSFTHVWPIDEKAGTVPQEWSGWPDGKKFALVLMHDVDTEKGHEKCLQLMQLDEKMGFRSSFNLVPERYHVSSEVRRILVQKGFEVGVHGLKHDGKLFLSRIQFLTQAVRINHYLKEWKSVGFVSPSMHRNLDWVHDLNVIYDASTFDTDPFEPQPEGVCRIFPFWVQNGSSPKGYIELPYTLPQDFTLFVLMKERNIDIWKKKLDWIAKNGGMALFITHPDYMSLDGKKPTIGEYPVKYYEEFLEYIKFKYNSQFWNVLPREIANFWSEIGQKKNNINL